MSKIETTYKSLYSNPSQQGFPPRPNNISLRRDYPASQKIAGDCPECGYRGTLAIYDGHNSYYECPECGTGVMVNDRDG